MLFLTPLAIALALLAPGQADWVLGIEFIAIGVLPPCRERQRKEPGRKAAE